MSGAEDAVIGVPKRGVGCALSVFLGVRMGLRLEETTKESSFFGQALSFDVCGRGLEVSIFLFSLEISSMLAGVAAYSK